MVNSFSTLVHLGLGEARVGTQPALAESTEQLGKIVN